MNNEDMSDMIQKLSSMMKNSNSSNNNDINSDMSSNSNEAGLENLQYILSNMHLNSNETEENNQENNNNNNNDNNNFNIDFETIMKMKTIMDKFNSSKNSPEANLLLSLKPYLNNNRKQKLDQYMQFLNITKIIEIFNSNGGVTNNDISK